MTTSTIIAHVDMDAFFATAEMIREPKLAGLPVVVGGPKHLEPLPGNDFPILAQYEGRGVLTTANYEARKLGLRSAMPTMKAAKLAPHAVLLPADFDWYKALSRRFKAAVVAIAPLMEDRGVDEIYLDLTEQTNGCFDSALALAIDLKRAVQEATGGMTCSIGLSANKLTSKICSDLQKPDGITLVRPEEFADVIWPLHVGKVNGIGPKAQAKLAELGVQTVGDLAKISRSVLMARFGPAYGAWLADSAQGIDPRKISLGSAPKSISRETTFGHDMRLPRDKQALSDTLDRLCERLETDLARKQVKARTIGIKLRFPDFKVCTRDSSASVAVATKADLLAAARLALKKVPFGEQGYPPVIRLLGVRASGLEPLVQGMAQMPLF